MVINKVSNSNKDIKKDKGYLKKDKESITLYFYFYISFINNSIIIIKKLYGSVHFLGSLYYAASNNLVI